MAKKRPDGAGTIQTLPSGKHRVGIRVNGVREWLGPFATLEEAESVRVGASQSLAAADKIGRIETLEAFGLRVIERRELAGHRSAKTDKYRWRMLAGSAIAGMPIDEISAPMIRRWVRAMLARFEPQTVRNALVLIRRVFAAAVEDDEVLSVNPAREVHLPRPAARKATTEEEISYLTMEEYQRLIAVATPEQAAIIDFAIGTGLRLGELCSLRLADVYAGDGETQPRVVVRYGGMPNKPTKSGRVRTVPLVGHALAAVRWWLAFLPSFCASNDMKLLFPTARGCARSHGRPLGRRYTGKTKSGRESYVDHWTELRERAGLGDRIVWHSLRHTCATWLLSGVWGHCWSVEEVQVFLGHEDVSTTQVYARMLGSRLAEVARITGGSRSPAPASTSTEDSAGAPRTIRTSDNWFRRTEASPATSSACDLCDPDLIQAVRLAAARAQSDELDAAAERLAISFLEGAAIRLAYRALGKDATARRAAIDLANLLDRAPGPAEVTTTTARGTR